MSGLVPEPWEGVDRACEKLSGSDCPLWRSEGVFRVNELHRSTQSRLMFLVPCTGFLTLVCVHEEGYLESASFRSYLAGVDGTETKPRLSSLGQFEQTAWDPKRNS